MKLKRLPEDFRVEERTHFRASGGRHAFYRLTKRGLGTLEAVEAVARRWNLARQQIGYGGLKDRHAVTAQYLSIDGGPRQDLHQTNFDLEYLGQAARPFGPQDIAGNRFEVTLRSLAAADRTAHDASLAAAAQGGVPNYFDDQRFGSVGLSGEFVAAAWCRGDYQRAVWLALAEPNVHDQPEDRRNKEALRQHWGDWSAARAALTRSHARSIVTYLEQHPTDFRRALALVRVDLRGLFLSAYQSRLWNEMLARWLRARVPAEQRFEIALLGGPAPFHRELPEDQRSELLATVLPLPSARLRLDEGPIKELIDEVLAGEGLELRELRVKYPRDSFFSRGQRQAILLPQDLRHSWHDDDLYAGRLKLQLAFDLPRGAYATMIVKRIMAREGGDEGRSPPGYPATDGDESGG